MIPAAFTILCLIGLGTAQSSSTVSLFIPIADPQSLVGSIAGSVKNPQRICYSVDSFG